MLIAIHPSSPFISEMIFKVHDSLQSEPVMVHEKLHTTFSGVVHPISTEQAAVHQYLGIKYASVPARFRQSRLFTSFPPTTDATRHGYVQSISISTCDVNG